MEEKRVELIRRAHREVQLATAQETEDGNPVVGAKHYLTAIELVVTAVEGLQHPNAKAEAYFLFQCRQKLEDYYARARLLLSIAEDEGLDVNLEDCLPTVNPSGENAFQHTQFPPALGAPAHVALGYPLEPAPLGYPSQASLGYPTQPSLGYPFPAHDMSVQPLGMVQGYPLAMQPFAPTVMPMAPLPQLGAVERPQLPPSKDAAAAAAPANPSTVVSPKSSTGGHVDPTSSLSSTTAVTPGKEDEEHHHPELGVDSAVELPALPPGEPSLQGPPMEWFLGTAHDVESLDNTAANKPIASQTRRMFADDDELRPGNPDFDDLFKKFTDEDQKP